MNLPPGFELEKESVSSLPPGFELEEETTASKPNEDSSGYTKYLKDYADRWNKPQIPGTQIPKKKTKEEWQSQRTSEYADTLLGVPEAALSFLAKLPAQAAGVPASLYALARGKRGKELEDIVAKVSHGPSWTDPMTDTGANILMGVGEAMQPFGLAPYANVGALGARGQALGAGRKLREATPVKPAATIPGAAVTPEVTPAGVPVPDWRTESPVAADIRVQQQNRQMPKADDYNNRDANVRAVEEEITAYEAYQRSEAQKQADAAAAAETQKNMEFQKAQQMQIDDHPYGDPPPQYGFTPEFGRVDENGIPIRADLSMEAANLENPLQRNLWGDELPGRNTQDQSIGMTQALDNMSPGPERARAVEMLSGVPDPFKGLGRNQAGAIPADVFKEGFRGINRWLSRLTEQPWVRAALPDTLYQTNPDGTPTIMLHGTMDAFVDQPRAVSLEGLHAGYGAAASMKAGLRKPDSVAYRIGNLEFDTTDTIGGNGSAVYPVVLKKGNYPRIPQDYGTWSPEVLANNTDFALEVSKNTKGKYDLFAVREILADWNNDLYRYKYMSPAEINASFAQLLKDKFDIDGFWYPNKYESTKNKLNAFSGELPNPQRARDLAAAQDYADSFVTWNDNKVESLYEASNRGFGRSQRGVLNFGAFGEEIKKIAKLATTDPTVVVAGKRVIANQVLGGLEGYAADITSPEAVIAMAPRSKDLTPTQKFNADTWRPGLRINTINSKNPLLKFANHVIQRAWTDAEGMARTYITDTKTGIGPVWRTLNDQEKVEIHDLLQTGDRKQRKYTAQELADNNFSPKQIDFIEKYYAMDDKKYEVWNDKRMTVGLDPLKYREGHFAGRFKGDYRTLVLDKDGKFIGYVGTDTKIGHAQALKAIREKFPDAKFTRTQRKGLGGSSNRGDMFSGLGDLLQMMAKDDPRIAQILEIVDSAIAQKADATFKADLHALDKKGIWGNEGNKPWQKDKLEAANDAMRSFFEYWEEGMISHNLMPVEAQLEALMRNPELDNMPKAKEYVHDYIKGMTGRSVGGFGDALNTLLDAPFKLLGLGPSIPRTAVNQFTKRMGQLTQGFMNIPYTVMQFTQVAQTGLPGMLEAAKAVGADKASVAKSATVAGKQAMELWYSKLTGDESRLSAWDKEVFKYAEERGLLTFSEFEEVSQATQSKAGRIADMAIDANRTVGEKVTRPYTFMTFVDILKDSGMSKQEIMDTAFNFTQDTMVDYSARERAAMFKNMGLLGQTAGNLQQFALTYLDQIGRWHKQALKGNPAPYVAGMTTLLAFAGIQGLPFFGTVDEIVEELTNLMGEKKNINTLVMQNAPEWLKTDIAQYGVLSDLTGLNISGRLGMADTLPDSFMDAVSPYASTAGRMATSLYDMGKQRDELSAKQAARQFAPSSVRGMVENQLLTTPDGMTINKDGQFDYPRTEFDRNARKWAMTSLEESKAKAKVYSKGESLKADQEKLTKLANKASRKFMGDFKSYMDSGEWKSDLEEYKNRGGDPTVLVNKIIADEGQRKLTSKQRAEGIQPNSIQALRRWQKINEE